MSASSGWTTLRTHTRADGAIVRLESSAAGRWKVSVRLVGEAVGEPLVIGPMRLGPELAQRLVDTFTARCIEPFVLPLRVKGALDAALAEADVTGAQRADLDHELLAGRPARLVRTIELLASAQRRPDAAEGLRIVIGQIRAEARAAVAALPDALRAALTLDPSEVRRGR